MKTKNYYIIGYYPYGNNHSRYYNGKSSGTTNRDSAEIYYKTLDEVIEMVDSEWKCDCFVENFQTEEIEYSFRY